jgi:putative PIG3 family NAD(P)H quinone oxidoreductase
MKAVLCTDAGDVSVLHLGDHPEPELKDGQIRIGVRASGVNRADILQRRGLYPPPSGENDILGLEVAGEVLEAAKRVRGWKPGDRVMALVGGGGYAAEVCVDSKLAMPLPANLSFEQGAAIPEAFITAHLNLFTLGHAIAESTVLVHAGASGVGTAAIQMLRRIRARVFATVGSAEKAEAISALGALAIIYRVQNFEEIIRHETEGRGVDIILDSIGAGYLSPNLRSLATDGRLIQIGLMGGRQDQVDLGLLLHKRLQLIGSTLRPLPLPRKRAAVAAFESQFLASFESGDLRPVVDRAFSIESVREAHAHMEANRNIGKIVLRWT